MVHVCSGTEPDTAAIGLFALFALLVLGAVSLSAPPIAKASVNAITITITSGIIIVTTIVGITAISIVFVGPKAAGAGGAAQAA